MNAENTVQWIAGTLIILVNSAILYKQKSVTSKIKTYVKNKALNLEN